VGIFVNFFFFFWNWKADKWLREAVQMLERINLVRGILDGTRVVILCMILLSVTNGWY